MKINLLVIAAFLICTVLAACTNYGKEKTYNGMELYRTGNVTEAQSDLLGNYLVKEKFADGKAKTVQLAKSGAVYQVRFVVNDSTAKDVEYAKIAKFLGTMISSEVFNGAPLEVHLCDDHLNTVKVLTADDFGTKKVFDGVELYHSKNITGTEVDSLGNYLVKSGFADGNGKSVQIAKPANTYQFKFVVNKGVEKDTAYMHNGQIFAAEISKLVFTGKPVELVLCDAYFSPLATVQMK
jgi:DUF971 family protein